MNIYTLILIVAGGIWLVGLFFGYMASLQKGFKNEPSISSVNSIATEEKKDKFIEETERLRQEKMDQLKQRMDDQKRYGR